MPNPVDISQITVISGGNSVTANLHDSQCPDVNEAIEAILDGVPNAPIVGTVTGTYVEDSICYQIGNWVFVYFINAHGGSFSSATVSGLSLPSTTIIKGLWPEYKNEPFLAETFYDGSLYKAWNSAANITFIDNTSFTINKLTNSSPRNGKTYCGIIFAVDQPSS